MPDEVGECCGNCNSFLSNEVLGLNTGERVLEVIYDGRCPVDSRGKKITDCCGKFDGKFQEFK